MSFSTNQMIDLGEICKFQNGYAFKSSMFKKNGKYKIIKIKELKNGGIQFFSDSATVDINIKDFEKYSVKDGDVLFALTGDPISKRNPLSWVGRVSIYKKNEISLLNQRVCKIIPNKKIIIKKYIYYFFRDTKNFLLLASKATGSASQANISTKTIANTTILLPNLPTQKKITSILSALDDKIELNNKINKNLEEMAQAIFKSWFVDFEPWGGEMPDDFKKINFEDFINFQEGPGIRNWQYVETNGTKFLNIRCIKNNDLNLKSANMVSKETTETKYKHFMLHEWDIIISSSGTLGKYAIIRKEHLPLCLNTSIIRFYPKLSFNHFSFIYSYLTSSIFYEHLISKACGSVQANFGPTHLRQIKLFVPDEKSISQYHNIIFPILKKEMQLKSENSNLIKLRDTLLPKLMSGELDVSDLDI